jgi:hypothetical protein
MNAVNVKVPVPFHALISTRMSNKMWSSIPKSGRCDRTTLVESASVATYLNLRSKVDFDNRLKARAIPVFYNIRNLKLNTSNPVIQSFVAPKYELLDDKVTKTFMDTIVEENAQANLIESNLITVGVLETIADTPTVRAILLTRFEKWLYTCVNGGLSTVNIPSTIPDQWKKSIFTEACISVGFKLTAPNVKRAIQLCFLNSSASLKTIVLKSHSRMLTLLIYSIERSIIGLLRLMSFLRK